MHTCGTVTRERRYTLDLICAARVCFCHEDITHGDPVLQDRDGTGPGNARRAGDPRLMSGAMRAKGAGRSGLGSRAKGRLQVVPTGLDCCIRLLRPRWAAARAYLVCRALMASHDVNKLLSQVRRPCQQHNVSHKSLGTQACDTAPTHRRTSRWDRER